MFPIEQMNWRCLSVLVTMVIVGSIFTSGCSGKSDDAEPTDAQQPQVTPAADGTPVPDTPPAQNEAKSFSADIHPPHLHFPLDDKEDSAVVLNVSSQKVKAMLSDEGGTASTKSHSVPGAVGTGLAFDGEDDTLTIPAASFGNGFDAESDFSVSFWWQIGGQPFPDGYRAILSNFDAKGGGIILYQRGSSDGKNNRLYTNFYVAGNASPLLTRSINVSDTSEGWHHFVFQREGAVLRAWRDGRPVGDFDDPSATGAMGAGNDLRISAAKNGVQGALDELRYYQRAITKSEIRGLASRTPLDEDPFFLAERLRDVKAGPGASPEEVARVKAALDKALGTMSGYPKAIGEDVSLLAFRYQAVGGDEYEMAFAFQLKKPLPSEYFIHVRGWVDPSHKHLLDDDNGATQSGQKWEITPNPQTSAWTPGEVIVVREWVKAANVPYRISVNLLDRIGDHTPLVRKYVELSWQASL